MQHQKIFYEHRLVFLAQAKSPERLPESPEEIEAERKVLDRLKRAPKGTEFTPEILEQTFYGISTEHLQMVSEHFAYSGGKFGALSNESVIGTLETEVLRRQTPDFNCVEFLNAFRVAWNERKTKSKDNNGLHNLPEKLSEKGRAAFGKLFPKDLQSLRVENPIFTAVAERMESLFSKRRDGAAASRVLDAMLKKKKEEQKKPQAPDYPSVNPS